MASNFIGNIQADVLSVSGASTFTGSIGNATTTVPSVMIGVSSGNDPQIQLTGNGVNPHIDFSNASGQDYDIRLINDAANQLRLTGGNMRFDGDVLVNGDLKMAGTDSYIWSPGTGSSYTGIYDPTYGVALHWSEANNGFGVGQNSEAGYMMAVAGNVKMTGGIIDTDPGSSWISQKTSTSVPIQETNALSSGNTYRAFIRSSNTNHVFTLGRLSNASFGFWRFDPARTANGTDGGCYMDGAGNWISTGDVTAYSDARLKSDIVTIEGALDKVSALRGVDYIKDGKPSTGVIAQEVEAVKPELVHTADDEMGTKSVAYGNMAGLFIEAIKELKDEVAALKAEIAELKK